jgi:hypothetical protein
MIKHFPEIQEFFKSSSFLKDELDEFVKQINIKYSDKETNNKAHTLIKLELFKFELQVKEGTSNKNITQQKPNSKKKQKKNKTPLKVTNESQNYWVNQQINSFANMPIEDISKILEVRCDLLIRLFKRRGYEVGKKSIISEKAHLELLEYAKNRLSQIYRQKKKEFINEHKTIKSKKKNEKFDNSVYSKLQTYGPGKLIYIKSK